MGCQANGTGGDAWLAILDGDRPAAINQPGDDEAFPFVLYELHLKAVPVLNQLEGDSRQRLVLPVDEQFLFISESGQASEPIVVQDRLELSLVPLQLREALQSQIELVVARHWIIVRVTEEQIGELLKQPVLQLGRRGAGRQCRDRRRGRDCRKR